MFLIKYKVKWPIDYVINAGAALGQGLVGKEQGRGRAMDKVGM